MNTPTKATPPASLQRADDARERAIAILTDRYAEGVLDDAGLELRLQRLHGAQDARGVEAVVADLLNPHAVPAPVVHGGPVPDPSVLPSRTIRRILAIMSESKRAGRWIVPGELEVVAVMSDVKLDFRHAALPPVAEIHVSCWMASVHLTVPPGLPVVFEADGFIGVATSSAIEPDAMTQGPVLRVVGIAVLGEVKVIVKEAKAK